jgi:cellobionic acid phosphorylase
VEGLCGLKGDADGLVIQPRLPAAWDGMQVERSFRGAQFKVSIKRANVGAVEVWRDGQQLAHARVDAFEAGDTINLDVLVPQ